MIRFVFVCVYRPAEQAGKKLEHSGDEVRNDGGPR